MGKNTQRKASWYNQGYRDATLGIDSKKNERLVPRMFIDEYEQGVRDGYEDSKPHGFRIRLYQKLHQKFAHGIASFKLSLGYNTQNRKVRS